MMPLLIAKGISCQQVLPDLVRGNVNNLEALRITDSLFGSILAGILVLYCTFVMRSYVSIPRIHSHLG